MTKIALALIVAATLQAGPHRAILAAAEEPAAAQDHAHAGIDHGGMPPARFESPTNYRTLNIDISDTGIEPATVFIPAGQDSADAAKPRFQRTPLQGGGPRSRRSCVGITG